MQDTSDLNEFGEKYKDILNFNKDSCFLKAKDILLISVHLTSKNSHVDQARNMFDVLEELER